MGKLSIHEINTSWVSEGAALSRSRRHFFEQKVRFSNLCLMLWRSGLIRGLTWTEKDPGISCVPRPWPFTDPGPSGITKMLTTVEPSAHAFISDGIGSGILDWDGRLSTLFSSSMVGPTGRTTFGTRGWGMPPELDRSDSPTVGRRN